MGKNFTNELKAMFQVLTQAKKDKAYVTIHLKDGSAACNVLIKEAGRVQVKGVIFEENESGETIKTKVKINFRDIDSFMVGQFYNQERLAKIPTE